LRRTEETGSRVARFKLLNWLPSSVFAVFGANGLPWKVAAYTYQGLGGQAA